MSEPKDRVYTQAELDEIVANRLLELTRLHRVEDIEGMVERVVARIDEVIVPRLDTLNNWRAGTISRLDKIDGHLTSAKEVAEKNATEATADREARAGRRPTWVQAGFAGCALSVAIVAVILTIAFHFWK